MEETLDNCVKSKGESTGVSLVKLYLLAMLVVALFVAAFGFVCPWLISMGSDEAVLLGFSLVVLLPVALFGLFVKFIKRVGEIKNL